MLVKSLSLEEWRSKQEESCMLDVRSPGEFGRGHIPGALNLPLFSDEERALVGTLYKQTGRKEAILKGLEIVGPKMAAMVEAASSMCNGKPILLHCWRGGMRSGSTAWLLATAGLKVNTLQGGYKTYRQWVLHTNAQPRKYLMVGGKTGSGKTEVIRALAHAGEQVIDLEALANHKGSAFGGLNEDPQPSNEHFHNLLAEQLDRFNPELPIWLEDESRTIGKVYLGDEFIVHMQSAPVAVLEIPHGQRIRNLLKHYGPNDVKQLKESMDRIRKKLGGQHHQAAIEALDEGDLSTAALIALYYYDKTYGYGLSRKQHRSQVFSFEQYEPATIARTLIEWKNEHQPVSL